MKDTRSTPHQRALWITFVLTTSFLVVEVVGALVTNSLALLADAGHMLTDVAGLALALFAGWIAQRPATPAKTYGFYRVEILSALLNAVVLFLISFYILYEAYQRFRSPPEIETGLMFGVAAVGLVVNLIGIAILRRSSGENLNVQGAFLEVVSDTLSSVGVLVAAVIIRLTGWVYADPVLSAVIGVFILPRTWHLMRQAVDVLLEATPAHINLAEVQAALASEPGVVEVHDLHVWSVSSGREALSAHVRLAETVSATEAGQLLERLQKRLREQFSIEHATLQLEFGPLPESNLLP